MRQHYLAASRCNYNILLYVKFQSYTGLTELGNDWIDITIVLHETSHETSRDNHKQILCLANVLGFSYLARKYSFVIHI